MFHLFGFPVRIRMGFVVFLGLLVFLYQNEVGLWLAGGLAVFTLIHELGHAVAARSAGATAEISLDFMAGYTAYQPNPDRPISRARRALISVAGPGVQIIAGLAVLYAIGANPFDESSVRQSAAAVALWWSGPVIGVINLIPVLPLDGGHLALVGVEAITKRDSSRTMVIISLVLTGAAAAWMAVRGDSTFSIFVVFLLITQLQLLSSTKTPNVSPRERLMRSEQQAWQTGTPGATDLGQQISPWFHAYQAAEAGNPADAGRIILDDLARPAVNWIAPTGATAEQLAVVVNSLPTDLPNGNDHSQQVLTDILLGLHRYGEAGRYAVNGFQAHGTSPYAIAIARAAAATGDADNAVAWAKAAADRAVDEGTGAMRSLMFVMASVPEFESVRTRPEFTRALAQVTAAAGAATPS